jgi:hypothetical protein
MSVNIGYPVCQRRGGLKACVLRISRHQIIEEDSIVYLGWQQSDFAGAKVVLRKS